jgi:hypothetical protein
VTRTNTIFVYYVSSSGAPFENDSTRITLESVFEELCLK